MAEQRFQFRSTQRLRKKAEFSAVFDRKQRISAHPLLLYIAPNQLSYSRLGISMSRRVGIAARRNRIKRLVREAFRLQQHALPAGWDIIVVPRPHEPMPLESYMTLLRELTARVSSKGKS